MATAAVSANEIDEFINGALVSWLESCLSRPEILTGYSSLLDGRIIHNVWLQIDPEPQNNPTEVDDCSERAVCFARAKNFECIVRNLKSLFEDELRQIILVLPNCYILGYHPETKQGLEQMKILLTLLLGAAVQCPNQELFISRIKELAVETQHAIVELIKQVTETHSLVLTEKTLKLMAPQDMCSQIIKLIEERDTMNLKWISFLCNERDIFNSSSSAENSTNLSLSITGELTSIPISSSSNTENNHMLVELADLKSKLRQFRQELEDKSESYLNLREELQHKNNQYDKLRIESQGWYSEAKRALAYRDEVDVLRERAEKADRLEIELQKFKEKLTDSEFYKTRVEELREDNRILLESKEILEEQLQRWRKKSEHVMVLESEIIKYKQKLNDMDLERNADRSRLEELIEENTQLQLVTKNLNSTLDINKTLLDNEDDCNSGDNSLSEQLTQNAQTRALKLELENRRLTAALDQLKESSFHESSNKILDLEKEKKKMSLKIEQLQDNIQRLSQQNVELENVFKEAIEENKKMQITLDHRQDAYEKQSQEREVEHTKVMDLEKHIETLNKEKQRILTLNESVQRRADDLERMAESRLKEIEQYMDKVKTLENSKENAYELQTKVNTFERDNASLAKVVDKLKENIENKSVLLDCQCVLADNQKKEILRLTKSLEEADNIQVRLNDLKIQNQELQSQRDIDLQTISTLRNDLVSGTLATNKVRHNLEKLGLNVDPTDDKSELNVETVVEKLVRNPETYKTVREIMLNVSKEQSENGNTKSDICVLCHRKEVFTVEKNIDFSSSSEAFEVAEITKLSEENTQLSALNVALQSTHDQLQAENARFKVDVATLGSQITSLNTQHVALQLANSQLAADKDVLLKENEQIKQEHKNLQHDQVALQCLHNQLSSEYESVNKNRELFKNAVRDLRTQLRESHNQNVGLEKEIDDLKQQNTSLKSCSEDLAILRTEHSKLTDDFRNLFATSERFKNEYKLIQEQYKMIRMENSKLKLLNTEFTGELGNMSDHFKLLEEQYVKSTQYCEMLTQQNGDLDTERKTLMENITHLIKQYHELLTLSLEDKKQFHEEEKQYSECVHNLHRQKEKLEEKIMELFKKSEGVTPKKKPFASNLVRRVKKASSDLMNKVPSRNRRSWIDDSRSPQSQFTVGSESGGNDSDNSTEEPLSISSDTHFMQRNIPTRQSLQRDALDHSISRGGTMRSSLQTHKRTDLNNSRRNSVHGLETPDVTGSSLTLGTAGSRRTVYLIDENQQIPETSDVDSGAAERTSVSNSGINTSTTAEPESSTSTLNSDNPAIFLMYNRINNTISGNSTNLSSTSNESSSLNTTTTAIGNSNRDVDELQDENKLVRNKRPEDKNNSIWYEYGCV